MAEQEVNEDKFVQPADGVVVIEEGPPEPPKEEA